jgi:two-component system NtrC family sensor kinase
VLNLSMILQRLMTEEGIPPERRDEFRRYLEQISDETRRVGGIVSDLLAFSRRSKPQRTDTDLLAIVDRTLSLVRHKLDLAGVVAEVSPEPDLAPVPCDPSQVEQVVLNLVMNACEAMSDGGCVRIRIWTDDHQRAACITVADDGPGISPDVLPRIYDPFFSTKGEGEVEGRGVGLGLAVVYGIVVSHGGTLDVESHVGRGTAFTARFPMRSDENGNGRREPT